MKKGAMVCSDKVFDLIHDTPRLREPFEERYKKNRQYLDQLISRLTECICRKEEKRVIATVDDYINVKKGDEHSLKKITLDFITPSTELTVDLVACIMGVDLWDESESLVPVKTRIRKYYANARIADRPHYFI